MSWKPEVAARLIHPITSIGRDVEVCFGVVIEESVIIHGPGFIGYYTIIRPRVLIGSHTEVRAHCHIAEEAEIGSGVKIFQCSNISKQCRIEDRVYIGAGVVMTNTRKISHGRSYEPEIEGPVIKYGARIGSGAIILPGITIGREALVGAGCVVTKDVPDYTVFMGIPGECKGEVPEDERL